MDAPCKDCKDRYVGCHGKCEKFGKWTEEYRLDTMRKRIWLGKTDHRDEIRVIKAIDRIRMYGDEETKNKYGVYAKTAYRKA